MFVKFRDFVMHVISSLVFKLGNFANFKALFSVVLMDFPYSSMKKKIEKHRGRAYLWVFQYYPSLADNSFEFSDSKSVN